MTKPTREAIARILHDSIPAYTEMLTCKDIADEILTALEPAQAGGDVRELVEALRPFAREADEWEGSERTDDYVPLIGDVQDTEMSDAMFCLGDLRRARSLVAAAKNTTHVSEPMEPTEDMLIAGNAVMDEYANEQIDRRREVRDVFKAMIKVAPEALTATPAQAGTELFSNEEKKLNIEAIEKSGMDAFEALKELRYYASHKQHMSEASADARFAAVRNALTTPAQPTPAGEVDGLIQALAETIDALELFIPSPMCRDCADENGTCPNSRSGVRPCDIDFGKEWARAVRDNASEQLGAARTALGGGWRDDMENADG